MFGPTEDEYSESDHQKLCLVSTTILFVVVGFSVLFS